MLVDLMDFNELVNIISLIDSMNFMAFMDLMRFATQGEIFTHMKLYPYVSVSNLTHMHFSKPQALTNFSIYAYTKSFTTVLDSYVQPDVAVRTGFVYEKLHHCNWSGGARKKCGVVSSPH